MMLNDDDLFLVGCVKLSAIKHFMWETAGSDVIARTFQSVASTGISQQPMPHPVSVSVKEGESGLSVCIPIK